jgi:hypothetical protein
MRNTQWPYVARHIADPAGDGRCCTGATFQPDTHRLLVIKITQRHWQAATREMRGDIGRQRAFAATTFRLTSATVGIVSRLCLKLLIGNSFVTFLSRAVAAAARRVFGR